MEDVSAYEGAPLIKAIDKTSVHRICSGQVVLTLAIAVKELVENSLDAGANQIEIRLKEHGSESIEVIDNGSGVEPENFKGLTLKYHTSKLSDFSDLTKLHTFGFRGEALSSLCSLSKLSVTTCHSSMEVGVKLEYDSNGVLIKQTPCPRQQGTTVCIQHLFYSLPVRHKEFHRNLKKEFIKMIALLNAYSIISTGVKLTCSNHVGKAKNQILSVQSNLSIKDNIINIFGSKQAQSIVEIKQVLPTEEVCAEFCIKIPEEAEIIFKLEGFISTIEHGKGRSITDRQYIFINKRPCDFPKLTKLINDVYHQYNSHQYPFVALDISLSTESVDVNVTKDKRTLFVEKEKLLFAIVKTSLLALLEPLTGQFSQATPKLPGAFWTTYATKEKGNPLETEKQASRSEALPRLSSSELPSGSPMLSNLKRSFASTFSPSSSSRSHSDVNTSDGFNKQRKLDVFLQKPTDLELSDRSNVTEKDSLENNESNFQADTIFIPFATNPTTPNTSLNESLNSHPENPDTPPSESSSTSPPVENRLSPQIVHEDPAVEPLPSISNEQLMMAEKADASEETYATVILETEKLMDNVNEGTQKANSLTPKKQLPCSSKTKLLDDSGTESEKNISNSQPACRREVTIPFSLDLLKKKSANKAHTDVMNRAQQFRAKITPGDNKTAEEELRKVISKESFKEMKILGQFNLGFIIAQLGDDLFIIDQHATDEKYNFEMLQEHTVIQSQKLIQPQNLELTAMNEAVLVDNMEVFNKNGFEFTIDESAPTTQRVKLTAMPVSRNWTFGKDDIEELIFMLSDSPGTLCRPSRIGQMFASRACRKSIMIGTALNQSEMKKLVNHMSEIDHPWNCPHGRPTMRHLINLKTLPD